MAIVVDIKVAILRLALDILIVSLRCGLDLIHLLLEEHCEIKFWIVLLNLDTCYFIKLLFANAGCHSAESLLLLDELVFEGDYGGRHDIELAAYLSLPSIELFEDWVGQKTNRALPH